VKDWEALAKTIAKMNEKVISYYGISPEMFKSDSQVAKDRADAFEYGVDYASSEDSSSQTTIDITDSCHVLTDEEQYGASPIKALLPLQDSYNKGGKKK
jgi:hypothetical protein